MQLSLAKDRLRIPQLWRKYNLPGAPSKLCKSPFREDKNPSFSVFDDGQYWNDFGTGEHGDAVDFLQKIIGCSQEEALKQFFDLADMSAGNSVDRKQTPINWPSDLRCSTPDERRELAALRGLSPAAFDLAHQFGTLKVGTLFRLKSWILTDSKHLIAEARRFDGELYPECGTLRPRKAHTIKGSIKGWPVGLGIPNAHYFKKILVVEGSADYFAGVDLVGFYGPADFLVCAMLGRSASIDERALSKFSDKEVIVIPHKDPDKRGNGAAIGWGQQIADSGAKKVVIQPLPNGLGNDLNDAMRATKSLLTLAERILCLNPEN